MAGMSPRITFDETAERYASAFDTVVGFFTKIPYIQKRAEDPESGVLPITPRGKLPIMAVKPS
jgi:hypothetical protein